ncbi:MAG: hypothetical protein KC535_01110, partial [Nanoarchaeota archaeon]|nr:hypothetical protein [Nanoarchaeota archaeon]
DVIDTLSFDVLVSNLPYHISEPLFIALLEKRPEKIVVVVGESFARHLKEETILGTVFRDAYEVELLEVIAPESFHPPPNTTSALVRCLRKNESGPLTDFYAHGKSKVKNYLKNKTPTKRQAQEFINKLPLPLQEKRLYELNKQEFLSLKDILQQL